LTLAGEERLRATTQGIDAAWETHKRIAREMNVNLPNLLFVLPDGQLLHAGNKNLRQSSLETVFKGA